MWPSNSKQLAEQVGKVFHPVEKEKVHGGYINECFMVSDGIDRYFGKTNQREYLTKFTAEVENLRVMRESNTVQVPESILHGTSKTHAYLVLNYLATKPLDDAERSYEFGVQ
ncbi:fructosamine kinase family protein, partial [Vibrio cholerae]|uniref:fructosamine kinase family protein n=1 Tax=Vibrio cholerae TaxID=666 RepID=UPI001E548425